MSAKTAKGQTFEALTAWRGICALMVALFHFPVVGPVRAFPLVTHAYLFVDFFFVLSGFVIAHAYEDRLEARGERLKFLITRIGRLWPLHVAVLAAFVVASALKHEIGLSERHSYTAILTNLAMIHGLGIHHDLTWNGPSWSISVEWALYLIFLGLSFLKSRSAAYVALACGGLVALAFWAPNGMASTFDFGVYRGLAGFFAGCLLRRLPAREMGTWHELAALALAAGFVSLNRWILLSPLVFCLAVYVFAHSTGRISKLLSSRPTRLLGERSYSIYMVHAGLVACLWALAPRLGLHQDGDYLAGRPAASLEIAAGYLAAVICLSTVTYALIETPGRLISRRLANRRARYGRAAETA